MKTKKAISHRKFNRVLSSSPGRNLIGKKLVTTQSDGGRISIVVITRNHIYWMQAAKGVRGFKCFRASISEVVL